MNEKKIYTLAIVVPCYNEEEVFPFSLDRLSEIRHKLIQHNKISIDSYLLFVDDGSVDSTWSLIKAAGANCNYVKGIKLSHNKGHQLALVAGLQNAVADMVVSIDADLQDDPTVIEEMVDAYLCGNDIVYGVRGSRKTDTWFKRSSAQFYYKFLGKLGIEQIYNHADYRLMSKKALHALLQYEEVNLYLRGLVPLIGFKSAQVFYERAERVAGISKYPFLKSLALGIEGITSLSVTPLRLISMLGFGVFLLSLFSIVYLVFQKILGNTIQGWTSVMVIVSLLGGLQMLALGIIGEYVGKIYFEVKRRPKYFIQEHCNMQSE